ncbi:MAG TPA: CoA pyrophosphatase [Xanthobacteraceae bacterium]|nr:CoA pyrophosphatase [Xanthobacteraceae bacterium]
MTYPFDETTRRAVAERCAAFPRVAADAAGLARAAVAVVLVQADEPAGAAAFVLTRRTADLRAHRNQWALPGGRCDAGETAAAAALRELAEEVGLRLAPDAVLGLLDDYPTRSGYLITPVVMWAAGAADLTPSAAEVASVHRIPLAAAARPDAFDFIAIPESDRRVVRFHVDGHSIHAPTAAVIYQFREVLAGRATRVADLEQPVFAWR